MKIKYKIGITAAVSILFLLFATYLTFNFAYFGYIKTNHGQQITQSFNVINHILNNEYESMKRTALDWAHWDDTYTFINDLNSNYISSNLTYSTLDSLDLKMMLFLDSKGSILYNTYTKLRKETAAAMIQKLLPKNNHPKALIAFADNHDIKAGLLRVHGQTFIVTACPITTSDELNESNGSLIMFREINEKMLNYIQDVSNVQINIHGYLYENSSVNKSSKFLNKNIDGLSSATVSQGNRILKDINGQPSIVLSIEKYNRYYSDVLYYFRIFMGSFLLIIAMICLIDGKIIHKYMLSRLSKLTRFMDTVATTKDTSLLINISGDDEFNKLAASANKMLSQLGSAYKNISDMNERFKIIMEATNDGYLDFNVLNKELYISPEWQAAIGYVSKDVHSLFEEYISRIHPECLEHLKEIYPSIMSGQSDYFQVQYRIIKDIGDIIWVLHRGKIVEKDVSGLPVRVVSTLTNITDSKNHEQEIVFLSYSDKLTGLSNRAYMEKQFEALDNDKTSNYFIIMGDLNGLKLTNDAFGHKEGDRLLYIVSNLLKESCAGDDIISRWGGDEFIILIKNKDEHYISYLIHRIKSACTQVVDFHFKISIALGYAKKDENNPDTESVMSLAEDRMYRNKLIEDKSARSATISSLSRTLHEKHSETEQHTMRIRNLSLSLGERLRLPQDKLDELELLALLHDIGKIGIPDHILMKPAKLTSEEWYIMKTHSEIGYRIAKSTPELSHIADEILSHHERFDGTGYPNGLRGEDIPILARIINIVDSFDVMTHKRVYKDASNTDYAIEELKRCSGTQFDPFIANEFISLLTENADSKAAASSC
ncbi:MAG: diguanylate cyclase [Clostridia bacterium]|jgi:diguanylate cyclase (GGDEF)-like protein/putative nucleotidyltransferase with HDIG domain/PAS domain S-box-containing protein|nr:diguanylate cyclase [Clostridia bacterium]